MFGGPPWGDSLKNYVGFSPFFQVDKVTTPLLLEFAHDGLGGLEMYAPLRYLGVPAELVVYDKEERNFVRPKVRVASMQRKTDWFNFWLLDKQDLNPVKQEQYKRWEALKSKHRSS